MAQYHSSTLNSIGEKSMDQIKIIYIYDSVKEIVSINQALKKASIDFQGQLVDSEKTFLKALEEFSPSIILADIFTSSFSTLQALEILSKKGMKIPLIVISDKAGVDQIMETIRSGASDYIHKDQLQKLPGAINSALEKFRLDKEQHEYIKRLESAETRFRALVENTVDAVMIIDPAGKVMYAAPSVQRVLGYGKEELPDVSIFDVIHPDDQQIITGIIQECLEKQGISLPVMQYRCKHKNGTWIWYEGTITNMLHDSAINGIVNNFHDITVKKLAEEELKESEEKYRAFFENSMDAILLAITDGRVLAANPAACKMFQMTEQEICDAGGIGFLVSKDSAFKNLVEQRKNTGKAKGEITLRRKDGSIFLGEISSATFNNFKGSNRTSLIIRDISERVKAQRDLTTSEERYRFLFEYSSTPKWIFDLENGQILDVNETAVKHYGYSREEFLKMITNDLKAPEELARMAEIHKGIKDMEGLIRFGIFTQVKKDGTKIKAEVSGHKCFLKNRNCMVIDSFDVTERENILEQLKDSREKLHTAQEIAGLGYWKRDLRKQEVYWSDELYKIVGRDKETFFPTLENMIGILHPDDRENYNTIREQTFQGKINNEFEYRIVTPDGTVKWIRQVGKIIKDEQGKPLVFEGTAQDITSKKLLELSLEESNRRNQMVSKATSDVIWDWDFKKSKAYWGEGFETVFGYNLKEIEPINNFWEQNIHPEDVDRVVQKMEDAINSTQLNWMVEYRFRKADNTYIHVLDKAFFIRDTLGKAIRMAGGMQDITERKELEELLDKANSLARIGSYELNFNTNSLYWNATMKSIHEVPQDFKPTVEKIKKFYHDQISKKVIIEAFENAVKNQIPFDVEVRIRTAKGNLCWVRVIGETESVDGKISKVYGSIQDINQRKQNEEALRLSNERYNIVTKATNDSIWDWDLTENKIIRPGKTLESTLGYEVSGPDEGNAFWDEHVNTEDWKRISENRKQLFDNPAENYWEDEYRFLKPDGTYAIIFDRAYISRDETGKAIRMIGASRDVTKLRESEFQLKALNEKLEKRAKELVASNEELEQFAYVASHDLQEPLRMVTNFLSQIEKKYNDLLDEKGKTYIHFAVDGAKRMRQMILDLLEFSRAGRIDSKYENVNLDLLVKDILDLHQKKIQETGARVSVGQLPVIAAPKTALRQVFQNLINNSLKYSHSTNGAIPQISISAKDNNDHWQFEVTDNGIGIDAQYFEKIFVIFQRLHDRSEYSGTGIGLAISKKIIENMGGKIWVESEPGKGSSFFFTIAKNAHVASENV